MFSQTKAAILAGLEAIRQNPERVVAALTAFVFAPLTAVLVAWLAKHFPGIGISTDKLEALMVAGFLGAVGIAVTWLRGRQKIEDRQSAERIAVLQATGSTVTDAKKAAAAKVVEDTTPAGSS